MARLTRNMRTALQELVITSLGGPYCGRLTDEGLQQATACGREGCPLEAP